MWDSMQIEGTEYSFLCFCRKYTMKKKPQPTKQTEKLSTTNKWAKLFKTLEWLISLLSLGEFSLYALRRIKHICAQILILKNCNKQCNMLFYYSVQLYMESAKMDHKQNAYIPLHQHQSQEQWYRAVQATLGSILQSISAVKHRGHILSALVPGWLQDNAGAIPYFNSQKLFLLCKVAFCLWQPYFQTAQLLLVVELSCPRKFIHQSKITTAIWIFAS